MTLVHPDLRQLLSPLTAKSKANAKNGALNFMILN
jgi:hypothetical protein